MNPQQPDQQPDQKIMVDYQRVAHLLAERFGPINGPLELDRATWQAAAEAVNTQLCESNNECRDLRQQVQAWTAAGPEATTAAP